MNPADAPDPHELVVADDGSIPAEQLARLGLGPGAHLRVVSGEPGPAPQRLAGSMPELPELTWKDFERASEAARADFGRL